MKEDNVKRSQHKWHAAKLILAVDECSKEFGSWCLLFNNCQDFTSKLEEYLINNERDWSSTGIITERKVLQEFAKKRNILVQFCL